MYSPVELPPTISVYTAYVTGQRPLECTSQMTGSLIRCATFFYVHNRIDTAKRRNSQAVTFRVDCDQHRRWTRSLEQLLECASVVKFT